MELFITMILGNVEDEWCFFTLLFMKSKLHNRLTMHLDLVVGMFAQERYTLDNFPFQDAIKEWSDNKVKYVVDD